jgi:uncharacterized membrane protein YczE
MDNKTLKQRIIHYLAVYIGVMGSFFVIFASTWMRVQANVGVSPWDVFHMGVSNRLPLTLGQSMIITGLVIIMASLFLGIRPHIITFLNMIFIGTFIDVVKNWGWFPAVPGSMVMRICYFACGTFLTALGTAMYMRIGRQYGPRDGLMMGLVQRTGKRVGLIRTYIEVSVVILGFLMGQQLVMLIAAKGDISINMILTLLIDGPLGIGTIVYSLIIGWCLELCLSWMDWIIKRKKERGKRKEEKGKRK